MDCPYNYETIICFLFSEPSNDCLVELLLARSCLWLVNFLAVSVNILESKLAFLEFLTLTSVEAAVTLLNHVADSTVFDDCSC